METNGPIDEDIELYFLYKKGNRKAFDTLFLKYYSILCAFGKYYIPIEDAEEVVLDIMMWLWENREFQNIETSLRSYLFRAVRNRCLDLISKNQTKKRCYEHMFAEEMQKSFEDPDFYVAEELMGKIEKAVMKLPESYRVAFEMSRYQDKTYKEISKELNVSIKLVEYRIQQALRILRVELKDYLPLITTMFPYFFLDR
ncbi:RNA polymerase sigma-70 factor [Bacteroides caccae]|uniref:RNA polymerase sigma-70 factor n=1 Tax=Bacteroides caccae TaxID=47678 RepID=UPI003562355D